MARNRARHRCQEAGTKDLDELVPTKRVSAPLTGPQDRVLLPTVDGTDLRRTQEAGANRTSRLTRLQVPVATTTAAPSRTRTLLSTLEAQPINGSGVGIAALGGGNTTREEEEEYWKRGMGDSEFCN